MNANLRPPNDDAETLDLLSHALDHFEPIPPTALEQAHGAHHMAGHADLRFVEHKAAGDATRWRERVAVPAVHQ